MQTRATMQSALAALLLALLACERSLAFSPAPAPAPELGALPLAAAEKGTKPKPSTAPAPTTPPAPLPPGDFPGYEGRTRPTPSAIRPAPFPGQFNAPLVPAPVPVAAAPGTPVIVPGSAERVRRVSGPGAAAPQPASEASRPEPAVVARTTGSDAVVPSEAAGVATPATAGAIATAAEPLTFTGNGSIAEKVRPGAGTGAGALRRARRLPQATFLRGCQGVPLNGWRLLRACHGNKQCSSNIEGAGCREWSWARAQRAHELGRAAARPAAR